MAKRGKSGFSISRFLILLGVPAVGVLAVFYSLTAKSEPNPGAFSGLEKDAQTGNVLYEVPKKRALGALSQDLQAKGLIPNAFVFKVFLRVTGQDKKIRAGFYYVNPSNSVLEMAGKLTAGKQATRSVTIPEGKTIWEIHSILNAQNHLEYPPC